MSSKLFKEIAIKYYDQRDLGDPSFGLDFLPYDIYKLNNENRTENHAWDIMQCEHTRTLLNIYNDLVDKLLKLYLLDQIISNYDENEQDLLRIEFTEVILHYCLYKPNEFKSRAIYCATKLCYITNLTNKSGYRKDLIDKNINFSFFKKNFSKDFAIDEFIESLNTIGNNSEFEEETDNYRNRNEHRLPPALEMGLTNLVEVKTIHSEEEKLSLFHSFAHLPVEMDFNNLVTYQFAHTPPLKAINMIPILTRQGERMKDVFYQYWNLVLTLHKAISS